MAVMDIVLSTIFIKMSSVILTMANDVGLHIYSQENIHIGITWPQ